MSFPIYHMLISHSHLVDIHLLDSGATLLVNVHLLLVLLLWLLLGGLLAARSALDLWLGLGSVHDSGASVNDLFPLLVHLGRGDDGVDVLGLLGLTGKLVVEPVLGVGASLNLVR